MAVIDHDGAAFAALRWMYALYAHLFNYSCPVNPFVVVTLNP